MGCRQVDFKQAMVRLAASPGAVAVDVDFKLGGRGGYLHARRECIERFAKAKVSRFNSLGRSLDRSERVNLINNLARQLALDAELQ